MAYDYKIINIQLVSKVHRFSLLRVLLALKFNLFNARFVDEELF